MITTMTIEQLLEQQYDLLGHGQIEGSVTEVRLLPQATQIFVSGKDAFIAEARKHTAQSVYVGLNPRRTNSGFAKDISHLTCLCLDIDPIRPKGEGSTTEAHAGAVAIGRRIIEDLKGGTLVSSGSGCHVYLPTVGIAVSNPEVLTLSIKNWMDAIRKQYTALLSDKFKMDPIHDLPRVIRLWGSHNGKSGRVCGPLHINPTRFEYVFSQEATKTKKEEKVKGCENPRFSSLCKTNKRLSDIVLGNISYPSRSEATFEFVNILAEAHFSAEEIRGLIPLNPTMVKEEAKDEADIKRIIDKHFLDSKSNSYSLIHNGGSYFRSLTNRRMGTRTGLTQFDDMVSGLKVQKLYIFAARPNDGKTSLITQLLTSIAEQGLNCLFYPTEVGSEPIFDKIVSRKTGIDLRKFQNGTFIPSDEEKIEKVKESISRLPLVVIEDFGTTLEVIEQGVRKYAPQVLAVDYFQAIKWDDPDSVGEKSGAVRRLKEIAGDYNLPIIIGSQLNRADGPSSLKNLKGTGALEEFGDVITYIHPNRVPGQYPVDVDLTVMKSKYSATGNVKMWFESSTCEFKEQEVPF